ncbi:MAG: hypothetical protein MUQ32_07215, partial [Chloroflexi bacterium]|nr:hypothetical protein [Chloroflexota bacterium]
VVWPPVARSGRAFVGIAWLALGAILLLVPSLRDLMTQLTGQGPQTLLPSFEAVYPWLLALIATSLFAGLGWSRRRLGETALRRRRLVSGLAIGLALVLVTGTAFASATVVNELVLGGQPALGSRFGPTDPQVEPPGCSESLAAGATARLDLRMDGSIDDRYSGQVVLQGIRDGSDVSWTGFAATRLTLGQHGLTRVNGRVWELAPGRGWTEAAAADGDGQDLDRQLVAAALAPASRTVAEDRGLDFIEGARARHCRIPLDGATLRRALPQVDLIVGPVDMERWRGDLDFWVFTDGQLGQADGRITGPAFGIDDEALRAGVRFRMLAFDRGLPISVLPPRR